MSSQMNPVAAAWPVDPNEIKLRKKYRVKKAGNNGNSKQNNSGGQSKKTGPGANTVNGNSSPAQYGKWAAVMHACNEPILG